MSVFEDETGSPVAAAPDILGQAQQLLVTLAGGAGANGCQRESDDLLAILKPLDLTPVMQAAVQLYPAARAGLLDAKAMQAAGLEEVAGLVEGLVNLNRFDLPPDWKPGEALAVQQSEALRKMLLAVVSDPRLVAVRIGEQLHRLRGAKSATAGEQRRLALETREIYAPLANRLGIGQFKWELEDLSLRFLDPDAYQRIARALNEKRAEREAFIAEVRKVLQEALWNNGINAEISGRPKHIYSIWRKMQRKDARLEQIFDIRAVRILVNSVAECYAALGIVHNIWAYLPGEFDDYIANPKDNDYQSLHTALIGPEGKTLEVQIRTQQMHRHAELGVAAHWAYKEGKSARSSFERKIRLLRDLLEPADAGSDLLDQIRGDVFEDRVYAVSPKGDVVEMPSGATPLDFAYHVHTQVGHRCRGARVNGRIVPLTYKIQNADRIEIITGRNERPSRDWLSPQLGYLAASRSRAKVRNWFRQRDKEQNRRQGREMLDRELARLNVRDIPVGAVARQLKYKDADALCVALGVGDVNSSAIASALQHLRQDDTADLVTRRRQRRKKDAAAGDIAIHGVGDLLYNFARCCRPVPPEHIAGYITLGRGVSVHRQDCGNFLSLRARAPERVIGVDWGASADVDYPAELVVQAFDRQGLLKDISTILSDERVSVDSVRTSTDRETMKAEMRLTIGVPGLPVLSRVMSKLEQLPNVTSVRRSS